MITLYNTRTKQLEDFKPLTGNEVRMYTCGPTVYNYAHIGNLRAYIFEDILRRTLEAHGYELQHVMNITDVGHLTDDADQGEDKLEKGARREGKTAWEIAEYYTESFMRHTRDLNILEAHTICKATDHIPEQIEMVQTLIDKGYTYETSDGIYFDTTKFPTYGDMANLKNQTLDAGARVDMGEKKNPTDFALWKKSPTPRHPERSPKDEVEGSHTEQTQGDLSTPLHSAQDDIVPKRQMEWIFTGERSGTLVTDDIRSTITEEELPLVGFPGWHIECSAMARKYLGDQFDIHCGGIDHIPVHHTNEIAQTEAVTGKTPSVNFWMHGEFLLVQGGDKMAKSGDNFLTLDMLVEKGYDPLAYRYFLLQAHYRKQLSFSWEALDAAASGLKNLRKQIATIEDHTEENPHLVEEIIDAVNHDLNTAEALGLLQRALKEKKINKRDIESVDKIFGLDLLSHTEATVEITPEIQALLDMRAEARDNKDWQRSDDLRDELENMGVMVKDTDEGQIIH